MDKRIEALIKNWQSKNILGFYCADKNEAANKILSLIPESATIGFSGSQTLGELELIKRLAERGNKIYDPYKPGISRQESLEIRKQGAGADYYLASANALSEKGELVFLSAYGNRIAGVSSAKNTIIVFGINKITASLEEAIRRSREYATPLNYKRLKWPVDRTMICQTLIIEAEALSERLKVIIVGENLGF